MWVKPLVPMWVKPQGDNMGKVTLCFSLPSKKRKKKRREQGDGERHSERVRNTHFRMSLMK